MSGPVDGNVCYAGLAAARCPMGLMMRFGWAGSLLGQISLVVEGVGEVQVSWKVRMGV